MDTRVVWAAEVLRTQRMPAAELGAVLETEDAEEIRHRLALHGERLHEGLIDQLRALSRVERLLTQTLGGGQSPPGSLDSFEPSSSTCWPTTWKRSSSVTSTTRPSGSRTSIP